MFLDEFNTLGCLGAILVSVVPTLALSLALSLLNG
jgi:hypothetical protein